MSKYDNLNELLAEIANGKNFYHLCDDEISELVQVRIGVRKTTILSKVKSVLNNCGFKTKEVHAEWAYGWAIVEED